MSGYLPLYVAGQESGLIQGRQNFLIPEDASPTLRNMYVWRERYKRKQGNQSLGRLRRSFSESPLGSVTDPIWSFNIFSSTTPPISENNPSLTPSTLSITISGIVFQDQGDGTLSSTTPGNSGTVNYSTGDITLTHTAPADSNATATFTYFPQLPVMGIKNRQIVSSPNPSLIIFDTKYAYKYSSAGFSEFIPGTTWTGLDNHFFSTTNFWVSSSNQPVLWATNFSGVSGDPIRYTDGTAWVDFAPQIDSSGNRLTQSLILLPFRGCLLALNTLEGTSLSTSVAYRQRIRWSKIGSTPFSETSSIVSTVNPNAWRDDIPGNGGFLDIPTTENITCAGFVRDNLVIYCQHSTWQLRYTGRSISPFQIEKINAELGSNSAFSLVNFDTEVVAWGDKGITKCDSFSSTRIDHKIPDLVYITESDNQGVERIQGARDFVRKIAYWIYPSQPSLGNTGRYPDKRLIFNYDNESWAIFDESITALGLFYTTSSRTWNTTKIPWTNCNFPWATRIKSTPANIGGNQQGFIYFLDNQTENDPVLSIQGVKANGVNPVVITSPNHNLQDGQIISIHGVIGQNGENYKDLNGKVFSVVVGDWDGSNKSSMFMLYSYSPQTLHFTDPCDLPSQSYLGGGVVALRDRFSIITKKFNFSKEGENIQLGYIDVLTSATDEGAFSINVYENYNETNPINNRPQNSSSNPAFNSVVPTTYQGGIRGEKYWQRIFCPLRAAFITLEWTFSDGQMAGEEYSNNVQIDAFILWIRKAGLLRTF